MHETGIVRDLVRRVEQAASEAGASKVVGVTVRIGALSQFSPEHFREHFDQEVRGTIAESAALGIEMSDDALEPNAQSIMIRSLELEIPEERT